jgi:hypothetical protein
MTLSTPELKKAQLRPTKPSPAKTQKPALRHAESVTSSARSGTPTISRAYSLDEPPSTKRMMAESRGPPVGLGVGGEVDEGETAGRRRAVGGDRPAPE